MANKILICGANGAGKSTLAKALSLKTGWEFMDIEDYKFSKYAQNPYEPARTREEESLSLILKELSDSKGDKNGI